MHFKLSNQKNFLTLMLVRFISLTGSQMQDFALSLYVFKKTGSATLFSSVIIAGFIPELLLTPISGVFADWVDRKKIIVFIDMLSGLVTVFFTVIYLVIGELPLLSIYVFVFILSLASAIYRPTISTIIPMIIKKEDLVAANGINSIIANLGNVLAPLIAGILFGFYGLVIIMVLNAISFILASVGELCINIPKVNSRPQKISFKTFYVDFSEGIKFINDKKIILKNQKI